MKQASKRTTVKIGPEIDAKLYDELVQVAKQNGQSRRHLLEKAIEHYVRFVVPSRSMVRPEVMAQFRRSTTRLIEEFGRAKGIRDAGSLDAAVFRPQVGYYNSLVEEAAALMDSLANNHAFVDGNKRIGFSNRYFSAYKRLLPRG